MGELISPPKIRDFYSPSKKIAFLLKRLGLNQEQLEELLGVRNGAIYAWRCEYPYSPTYHEMRIISRLVELVRAVGKRMTSFEAVCFFGEPNKYFYNDRPVDVLATEIGYRMVRCILEELLTRENSLRFSGKKRK